MKAPQHNMWTDATMQQALILQRNNRSPLNLVYRKGPHNEFVEGQDSWMTTDFQAEVLAIKFAGHKMLASMLADDWEGKDIFFCSGRQATLLALSNEFIRSISNEILCWYVYRTSRKKDCDSEQGCRSHQCWRERESGWISGLI